MWQYVRFRLRRGLRHSRRNLAAFWRSGYHFLGQYVFGRLKQLLLVRRFVAAWLLIVVIAAGGLVVQVRGFGQHYLQEAAIPGGTYTEGVVGEINAINPLYPENQATSSAINLVFNGLTKYDEQGNLVGDLAKDWQVDSSQTVYTVHLRQDVRWHDGQKFTAEDVVFTVKMAQNPDARSPLRDSWRDVEVSALDANTVQFKLPDSYTPFPHLWTMGILPEHLLSLVSPSQLRLTSFNQEPVGTGPFKFSNFQPVRSEIAFAKNQQYFRGEPQLDTFVLRSFKDQARMQAALKRGEITAASLGLPYIGAVASEEEFQIKQAATTNVAFAFFNTAQKPLNNVKVRQSLANLIQPQQVAALSDDYYRPAAGPLLPDYLKQTEYPAYRPQSARKTLDQAGWHLKDGRRQKNGNVLKLELVAPSSGIYPRLVDYLQKQWSRAGVKVEASLVDFSELESNYIQSRSYDVLLRTIKLGADPDAYPYWHSSQAAYPGLNFSQYQSAIADLALEAGRTRKNGALRQAKYQTFYEQWWQDLPAVPLYQANYLYAVRRGAQSLDMEKMVNSTSRYHNVQDWTIRTTIKAQREVAKPSG